MPEGRDAPVVQVGGRGPDSVQGRGYVSGDLGVGRLLAVVGKPALAVRVAMFGSQGVEADAIGVDVLDIDHQFGVFADVSIGRLGGLVSSVASSAVVLEDQGTFLGLRRVDRQWELWGAEFFEEAVDFAKVFFPETEFVGSILANQHELHESFVAFFGKAIDVQMGLAVEVPPGWGIHIVVDHGCGDTVGVDIQIGVAKVHQSHAEHDCVARAVGGSQGHDHRAEVHLGQRFAEFELGFPDFFGQRFKGVGRVRGSRIACTVEVPTVAGKAVHHILSCGCHDVLQGAFGVIGASRKAVGQPGCLSGIFLEGKIQKRPSMIECIEALEDFFVEVGRKIDFLGQSFVSGFGFPGHRIFESLVLALEARCDGITIFSP